MADLSEPETFPTPTDAGEDVRAPGASDHIDSDLGSPASVSGWPIYTGPPDSVTDGVPPRSAPSAPRHNGLWTAAVVGTVVAVAAAAVGVVAATIVPAPQAAIPVTGPKVIAPAVWSPVDPSLTAGLVVVSGAAEADGIVMTPGGLVATSYSRINGDLHPPADGFGLRLTPDHQGVFPASITHADAAFDIAFLSATDFTPSRVARPGTPVHVGDVLTLLDDQGGRQPVLGIGVTVTATEQTCSRVGSKAHPTGFQFSLNDATAEPGAALVRADGTVVGMYFGGNDATHHYAIPIADVVKAMAGR